MVECFKLTAVRFHSVSQPIGHQRRETPAAISSQVSTSSQHALLPSSSAITERDGYPNNVLFSRDSCPNSSGRVRTFPNDVADSSLDDEITSDNGVDVDAGYLWYGTRRLRNVHPLPRPRIKPSLPQLSSCF